MLLAVIVLVDFETGEKPYPGFCRFRVPGHSRV